MAAPETPDWPALNATLEAATAQLGDAWATAFQYMDPAAQLQLIALVQAGEQVWQGVHPEDRGVYGEPMFPPKAVAALYVVSRQMADCILENLQDCPQTSAVADVVARFTAWTAATSAILEAAKTLPTPHDDLEGVEE